MANIISIATAVPEWKHSQEDILSFMQASYQLNDIEKRKLKFLYHQSGIHYRHSVIKDYGQQIRDENSFIPLNNTDTYPTIDKRMQLYNQHALPLSMDAAAQCFTEQIKPTDITHLITVSCTGMSAPGLDLALVNALALPPTINRTSINFMGCYAAIHALKQADYICKAAAEANVLIVCTELCTLHFQKESTPDNITSSLLFADGAAAVIVSNQKSTKYILLNDFYSKLVFRGNDSMAWHISKDGFLMTLSSYVPQVIEEDIDELLSEALSKKDLTKNAIQHWCIHPGGKKILEAFSKSTGIDNEALKHAYHILSNYGNMSSPTVLFVLKEIWQVTGNDKKIFGCAFGPGLTIETFIATAYTS